MKKRFLIVAPLLALCLSSCATNVHHDTGEYILETEYHADFRILQLTDTHLSDLDDLDTHYKFLDLLITEAHADYIVVTGDLFTITSRNNAMRFFNFLDSYNKPWSVVYGNHDEQCSFSVDWLTEQLNTKFKNCMFKDIQDDDVFGNCNYVVNLKKGTEVYEQLIFMDSNRYDYSGFKGYDHFKENQIDWYKRMIGTAPAARSLMFYHIPLPEINDAYEKGTVVWGEKREDTCPPKSDPGFFKVIKEGTTDGMFFGHDHVNDFEAVYEGVTFCYGLKSTDRIYYDEDMLGYKVITLHDDINHSFDIERVFHTYKEVM